MGDWLHFMTPSNWYVHLEFDCRDPIPPFGPYATRNLALAAAIEIANTKVTDIYRESVIASLKENGSYSDEGMGLYLEYRVG